MVKIQLPQCTKYLLLISVLLASVSAPLMVRAKVYANGGYPWSGAVCVATGQTTGTCPNYEWSYNGQTRNSSTGNYYYRNCTDYVAWKLMSVGIAMAKVSGLGSGGAWDDNAPAKGLSVSTVPAAGSVGVDERYGHVVYVEGVSGGNITVSEYNWGSTGSYGTRVGTASQLGLTKFVNFGLSTATVAPVIEQYWSGTGVKNAQFLGTYRLQAGQQIRANQYIESYNTKHVLLMQPDGNLVQYGDGFRVIWNSRTNGNLGAYTVFQGDGNLVVYAADGRPLWSSGVRSGGHHFDLQDDGHMVTYNAANKPLWWSGITVPDMPNYFGTSFIMVGQQLFPNNYLRSADGRFSLIIQKDGNLVVYGPGHHALWHSKTYGIPGLRLAVQSDGNLVLYNGNNVPYWWTGVKANPSHIIIQPDGNLVQYNRSGAALWNTITYGKT